MNLDEAYDVRTIQLEPRLQEYIRRKKFNEENDIVPTISVEQEFGITDFDIKMINQTQLENYPTKEIGHLQ